MAGTHPEWLSAPFVEEAEYLGRATGTSGSVFGSVAGGVAHRHAIPWLFSHAKRRGLGMAPRAVVFVQCEWVSRERQLFLFQELSANRKTPQETEVMVAKPLAFAGEP